MGIRGVSYVTENINHTCVIHNHYYYMWTYTKARVTEKLRTFVIHANEFSVLLTCIMVT
jgi:hypothetical protein